MKKIIFITKAYKVMHEYIIDCIQQYLSKRYYVKRYSMNCDINDITQEECDCILFFNQYSEIDLNKLRKAFPCNNFILLFCYSDILSEYPQSVASYDDYIMFEDAPCDEYTYFARYSHINKLKLPLSTCSFKKIDKEQSGFICVEGDYQFVMNNLGLINKLSMLNHDIILLTNNTNVENYINQHIQLKISDKCTMAEWIKKSQLFIGSSVGILMAIKHGIPCLIAGKYGYGRYLTEENFLLQWKSGFNGRIGACKNEIIPFDFIKNDISEMKEYYKNHNAGELVYVQHLKQLTLVENNLVEIISDNMRKGIHINSYIMNPDFIYSKMSDDDYYLVYDAQTKHMKYLITNDEYEILCSFTKNNSISKISSQFKGRAIEDIYEYITETIKNKLLIKP